MHHNKLNNLVINNTSKTKSTFFLSQKQENSQSKRSVPELLRINRRIKQIDNTSQQTTGKCIICLGNYEQQFGKLPCGHIFCLQCVTKWWRNNDSCPYCRSNIPFIQTKNKEIIHLEDLPKQTETINDDNFIPHCQLCWAQIQENQNMNICTICRAVYWHSRCLPFPGVRWYCQECAGEGNQ